MLVGAHMEVVRQVADAGNIRADMFALIIEADLVICDITVHNANVFYELGIRHARLDFTYGDRDAFTERFLDRLLTLALPRIRDFRGLKANFDGNGNYTLGVTEQLIFPEIDYDAIDAIRGMDITFVTSAKTDEHGRALLDAFGFPFLRPEGAPAPSAMQRLAEAKADTL